MNKKPLRKRVFVDTSAIILFLHGNISQEGKEIFQKTLQRQVNLITTSRCIDELIFKEMVILAKEDFKIENKTLEKLRKNPQMVKLLGEKLDVIIKPFIKTYNIEVLPIKNEWIFEIPKLMKKLGLFGNDALTIRAMKSKRIKTILTADKDFEKVKNILNITIVSAI